MVSINEIENKVFKKNKIGGYNIDEVDSFMQEIIASYRQLYEKNNNLEEEIKELKEQQEDLDEMKYKLKNMSVVAEQTSKMCKINAEKIAQQIENDANERAEKIISVADKEAEEILGQGQKQKKELDKQIQNMTIRYNTFKEQIKAILQEELDFLEQSNVALIQKDAMITDLYGEISNHSDSDDKQAYKNYLSSEVSADCIHK